MSRKTGTEATRAAWPDETAEEVIERTRREQGDAAAEIARRAIFGGLQEPRRRPTRDGLVGAKERRTPTFAGGKPGDRGADPSAVQTGPLGRDFSCRTPGCSKARKSRGYCGSCYVRISRQLKKQRATSKDAAS